MTIDRTWEVSKGQVRRDFTYLRQLMRDAEQAMRDITEATDLSDGGEVYQLALEMAGVAHQFGAWIVSERRLRQERTEKVETFRKLRTEGKHAEALSVYMESLAE